MKKLLLAAALLLAGHSAISQKAPTSTATPADAAGSIQALDAKNGFRTYKFGADMVSYANLKLRGKGKYQAIGENMTIGDVKLSSLEFGAQDGKLATVSFGTVGTENAEKLLEILVAQYGPGQTAGYEAQAWKGDVVTMLMQRGGTAPFQFAVIMISSNELMNKASDDRTRAAKKAANDL
jgi:hypothetical protein